MAAGRNTKVPQRAARKRKRPPKDGETDIDLAERRLQAVELRRRRYSYRQIARAIGVDVHTAYRYVEAELTELRTQASETTEELRALEVDLCDHVIRSLWSKVGAGDPKAALALLKASDSRRRLLGLDVVQEVGRTENPIVIKETHVFAAQIFNHPTGPQAATELLAILAGTGDAPRDASRARLAG